MNAFAAVAGAISVFGVLIAIIGLVPTVRPDRAVPPRRRRTHVSGFRSRGRGTDSHLGAPRWLGALAAGATGWLFTGWPIVGIAAAIAVLALPWLRAERASHRIDRLEALEQWTRRLADLLTIGSGIEQALIASVRTAPAPIEPTVLALAARLRARTPTELALRAFADDLDDPAGDLVAAALILATRRRGRGLAQILDGLARAVADEVNVRRGIEADRAKPRTTARAVTWISLVAAGSLILVDRAYVAPFGTAVGQVVLAAVLALFAGAFVWMRQLAAISPGHRFLVDDRHPGNRAEPAPTIDRGAGSLHPATAPSSGTL